MYSNNLNGAYEYESERRNDERRAAAESQLSHGLDGRRNFQLPSRVAILGALAVIIVFIRIF